MTYKEKLKLEHPDAVGSIYSGGCRGCPWEYGYSEKKCVKCSHSNLSTEEACTICWNSEMPASEKPVCTEATRAELIAKVKELQAEKAAILKELERLETYREFDEVAASMAAMRDAFIANGFTREEAMTFIFNAQRNCGVGGDEE